MRKRLALIQASRAILPVLVMLYHVSINMKDYWDYNFLHFTTLSSYVGVHYFFALSGFILFYIYKDKFGQQGQLRKYWLHRLIRIYPLYWLLTCIAGTVLLFFPFLGPGNKLDVKSTVYSLLLLPNPQGTAPILDVA